MEANSSRPPLNCRPQSTPGRQGRRRGHRQAHQVCSYPGRGGTQPQYLGDRPYRSCGGYRRIRFPGQTSDETPSRALVQQSEIAMGGVLKSRKTLNFLDSASISLQAFGDGHKALHVCPGWALGNFNILPARPKCICDCYHSTPVSVGLAACGTP